MEKKLVPPATSIQPGTCLPDRLDYFAGLALQAMLTKLKLPAEDADDYDKQEYDDTHKLFEAQLEEVTFYAYYIANEMLLERESLDALMAETCGEPDCPEHGAQVKLAAAVAAVPNTQQAKQQARLLARPIQDLPLRLSLQSQLLGAGITTIGNLINKYDAELLELPGVGEHSIKQIKLALNKWDLRLRLPHDD